MDEEKGERGASAGPLTPEEKRHLLESLLQESQEGLADALLEQARRKLQVGMEQFNQGRYADARRACKEAQDFIAKEVVPYLAEFPERLNTMSQLIARAKNLVDRAEKESTSVGEGRTPRLALPSVDPVFVTPGYTDRLGPGRSAVSGFPTPLLHYYDNPETVGAGVGGYAQVFKALNKNSGRTVAVKVYHQHSLSQALEKDFMREAEVWRGLRHRNIVQLYDDHFIPCPYLEMEFVPGGNLAQYLQNYLANFGQPLPVDEAALKIMKLAESLVYAHGLGRYHGDIKPENILLTQASPQGEPKLSDWGLGRLMAKETSFLPSEPRFTLRYATPEHFLLESKQEKLGLETDVFQLGLVFYEMVTGTVPFWATTKDEMKKLVLNANPRLPSAMNEKAERLDGLIMGCLAKLRHERPSLRDVLRELAGFLNVQYGQELNEARRTRNTDRMRFVLMKMVLLNAKYNEPQACRDFLSELLRNLPPGASQTQKKVNAMLARLQLDKDREIFTKDRDELITDLESLEREVGLL